MISISATYYGPLYFRGTSTDFIPVTGVAQIASPINGYLMTSNPSMPIQLLGYGIYLYTRPPGHEIWLLNGPDTVRADIEFFKRFGYVQRAAVKDIVRETYLYTERLKRKYVHGIRDLNTNLTVIWGPDLVVT